MSASSQPVESFDLVIFGGTGDLAMRKLLPALFHRFVDGQIPASSRILGVAREELDDDAYRDQVRAALSSHGDDTERGQARRLPRTGPLPPAGRAQG